MEALIGLGIVAAACAAYCLWSVVSVNREDDDEAR